MRGELQDLINARQERDSVLDTRSEVKRKTWHDKNALFASKAREDNKARPEITQTKKKRKRKLEDKAKPEDGERHQMTRTVVEKKRREKAREDYARGEKARQEKRQKKREQISEGDFFPFYIK